MNIIPIKDKVALVKLKTENTTASGIIVEGAIDLAETSKGKVIATGPDVEYVKDDDLVLVDWSKAVQSKLEDIPFYLIKEEHIIAVVEE